MASMIMAKNSNGAPTTGRGRRPVPAAVIAYLSYAVEDVRALSARSTSLLESAIENLIEETKSAAPDDHRSA
jgi:hypothetical protein